MRAVQITRFGGPEVLDVVDLPDPTPASSSTTSPPQA
jgi:NADPH2:quinone reductase